MNTFLQFLAYPIFFNVMVAFGILFVFQAKVIFALFDLHKSRNRGVSRPLLGNPDSQLAIFGRFLAGEFHPELRRKWSKAWAYMITSVLVLLGYVILQEIITP